MQKKIEINGQKYLAVVVPKDALNFRIVGDGNLMFLPNRYSSIYNLDLWIENWEGSQIIGTLDSLTEEQAKEIFHPFHHQKIESGMFKHLLEVQLFCDVTWNESSETVLLIKII